MREGSMCWSPRQMQVETLEPRLLLSVAPLLHEEVELVDGGNRLYVYGTPCPSLVDWNADGRRDLLVGEQSGHVRVFLNVGTETARAFNGSFLVQCNGEAIEVTHGCSGADPFAVDWDNDGLLDLLIGEYSGYVRIYLNEGTPELPVFTAYTYLQVGGSDYRAADHPVPSVVDWNNDGRKDVLCGRRDGRLSLLINAGTDAEPVFDQLQFVQCGGGNLQVASFSAPAVADWNGDGKKDLVVGSSNLGRPQRPDGIQFFPNVGNDAEPAFEDAYWMHVAGEKLVCGYVCPWVDDWDLDGVPDLLWGSWQRLYLHRGYYPGQPDLFISGTSAPSVSAGPSEPVFLDFDVTNLGDAASGPSALTVYLSPDDLIDAEDPCVAVVPLPTLEPNATYTCAAVVPGVAQHGFSYLGAVIDAAGTVEEVYETNNASSAVVRSVDEIDFSSSATTTAHGPIDVHLCDWEGNGFLDALVATEGQVWLYPGLGDGTFAAPASVGISYPMEVVPADLNGDGHQDLAVYSISHGTFTIFLNTGAGFVFSPTTYDVPSSPEAIAVHDLDGDSDTDLALATLGGMSIYWNDGAGGFSAHTDFSFGSASDVVTADLDGDMDPDLALAGYGGFWILFNEGSGVFGPPVELPEQYNLRDLAAGDLDGDGDVDLVGTFYWYVGSDRVAANLLVYNDGGGTFVHTKVIGPDLGEWSAQLVDVDQDGDLDLLRQHDDFAAIVVSRNDGTGNFGTAGLIPVGRALRDFATGDMDGDNRLDVVTVGYTEPALGVHISNMATWPAMGNRAPYAADWDVAGQTATENVPFHLEVPVSAFADPDLPSGDLLTLSASGLPAWLSFTGTCLTGTPGDRDILTAAHANVTLTATDTAGALVHVKIGITIYGVNDPPANAVPASQWVERNQPLVFSASRANAISVYDVETWRVPTAQLKVTMTATNGTLTLGGTAGLTFLSGDGAADPEMIFTGTVSSINAALEGTTFLPQPAYCGPASVEIITNDQGNYGYTSTPLSDTDVVSVTVTVAGDCTGDGFVEGADYTIWADHYGQGTGVLLPGDANHDGKVDGSDNAIWADHYKQAGSLEDGDFNGDGFVDGADYTVWSDHHLLQVTGWLEGDFNGDGFVDGADYTVWADNFECSVGGLAGSGGGTAAGSNLVEAGLSEPEAAFRAVPVPGRPNALPLSSPGQKEAAAVLPWRSRLLGDLSLDLDLLVSTEASPVQTDGRLGFHEWQRLTKGAKATAERLSLAEAVDLLEEPDLFGLANAV